MSKLKTVIKSVKTKYGIDFNKTGYYRLKEEALECYMKDETKSYTLDIMADLKELLTDKSGEPEDKKFYVNELLKLIP